MSNKSVDMSSTKPLTCSVFTDGGCRGNPGPGSWAFVVYQEDRVVEQLSGFLPSCTNNQAEYRGFAAACITFAKKTLEETPVSIEFFSDSMLVVEQINGRWRVKDEVLRPYFATAMEAFLKLSEKCNVSLTWVKRDKNAAADKLCNEMMDKHGVVWAAKDRA